MNVVVGMSNEVVFMRVYMRRTSDYDAYARFRRSRLTQRHKIIILDSFMHECGTACVVYSVPRY